MKKIAKVFRSGQKGFTLVELLVVIAIIGVLAALIVPNIGEYIGRGEVAAQESELTMVKNAVAATMSGAAVGTLENGGIDPLTIPVTINSGNNLNLTGPGGTFSVSRYFEGTVLTELQGTYLVGNSGNVTQTAW